MASKFKVGEIYGSRSSELIYMIVNIDKDELDALILESIDKREIGEIIRWGIWSSKGDIRIK